MKMKKTLAIIMAAALTVGTMAGCSQATLNYSKECANASKWEAVTSDVAGTVNIDVNGVKEEVTFTVDGYKANDQSYVDMKFNNTSGKVKIPELKAYTDGTTTYINKSFYEGLSSLTGQTASTELSNIKEEYIAVESEASQAEVAKIKELVTQPDSMVKLGALVFGENNSLDLPFVKNGREYTLNLDADQTVELAVKAIKEATNNLDNLNTTFKLGLTSEEIAKAKTEVNANMTPLMINQIKTALNGSTITLKDVFTDTSYTSDFNMNLQLKDAGKISIAVKGTSTKSEVKAITFPTSKVKLTAEEFSKLNAGSSKNIVTNTVVK